MPEDHGTDLAALTLAVCQAVVGTAFVRDNNGGPDVRLTLAAAATARRDPTATGGGDRPFTLLFEGPPDPVLTQGMHDLEHPSLPLRGLFLTRVSREVPGVWYEAVFA